MVAISVIFEGNAFMQSALGLQVLFIAILLHMSCRPYIEDVLDYVETFSLASSILCLSCGGLLLNDSTPPNWKITATILIFVSIFLFLVYVIYQLYRAYRENLLNATRGIQTKVTNILEMVHIKSKKEDNNNNTETIIHSSNPMHKKKKKKKEIKIKKVTLKQNSNDDDDDKTIIDSSNPKHKTNKNIKRVNTDLVIKNDSSSNQWIKAYDEKSGNHYWYNEKTSESRWDDPKI